jgi:hypothetical protein
MNACGGGGGTTLPVGSGIPSFQYKKKLLLPQGKKVGDARCECVFDVTRARQVKD